MIQFHYQEEEQARVIERLRDKISEMEQERKETFQSVQKERAQNIIVFSAVAALSGVSIVLDLVENKSPDIPHGTTSSGIAFVPNAQGRFVELSEVFGKSKNLKPCEMTAAPIQPTRKTGAFSLN